MNFNEVAKNKAGSARGRWLTRGQQGPGWVCVGLTGGAVAPNPDPDPQDSEFSPSPSWARSWHCRFLPRALGVSKKFQFPRILGSEVPAKHLNSSMDSWFKLRQDMFVPTGVWDEPSSPAMAEPSPSEPSFLISRRFYLKFKLNPPPPPTLILGLLSSPAGVGMVKKRSLS